MKQTGTQLKNKAYAGFGVVSSLTLGFKVVDEVIKVRETVKLNQQYDVYNHATNICGQQTCPGVSCTVSIPEQCGFFPSKEFCELVSNNKNCKYLQQASYLQNNSQYNVSDVWYCPLGQEKDVNYVHQDFITFINIILGIFGLIWLVIIISEIILLKTNTKKNKGQKISIDQKDLLVEE